MRELAAGTVESLAPLRAEILARAHAEGQALARDAARDAATAVAEATAEAERISARAVDAGVAAARSDAALRSARERRRAHELRLAGRESLRVDLEGRVLARAAALRNSPEYPRLLASLRARAVELLGEDATIVESPDGGIVATEGARRLDLTLPTLAKATLASIPGEVSGLWTE